MARTSAELTPEEILLIGDLVPVWSPWQVPAVNAGWTGLEYKTFSWGWDALTSNPLSQFASTTSAQLAGVISDETWSGWNLVFSNSPTLTLPNIAGINVSWGILTLPTGASDTLVRRNATETLTNKTIALWSNTLTWTLSQFNTACTDADFATGWGTATGTNTGDNATNTTSNAYALTTPDFYKYSIVRTVASGNMTVALKNYEGNDPTSAVPVKIQIWDTVRTITSALSFTSYSWFNWLNLWSTEIATKEVDLFTYFIWRSWESAVRLTASRFPTATTYNDFNIDALNEKWNLGNFGSPVSTDPVVNIGRFNAILSAGAGYTWSIPATSVIINSPIYETRVLQWGSQTGWTANNLLFYYTVNWDRVDFSFDANWISNSTSSSITLPFSARTIMTHDFALGLTYDNGAEMTTPWRADLYGATCNLYKDSAYWAWTSSWPKIIRWQGHYYI